MRLELQFVTIKDSKSIDNMGAQVGINVFRDIFATSLPVPSPVGEVANNNVLVVPSRQSRPKTAVCL